MKYFKSHLIAGLLIVVVVFHTDAFAGNNRSGNSPAKRNTKTAATQKTSERAATRDITTAPASKPAAKQRPVQVNSPAMVNARVAIRTQSTPPPLRVEVIPVRPYLRAVWIPGYWFFDINLNRYIWISGYRDLNPVGIRWVPGYWGYSNSFYYWQAGYWVY